jgi:DNA-binding NtrC family response regulator/tetratricopeptide (TPR) repeat protein
MVREAALPIHHPTARLVGQTPAIQALRAQIRHLAAFDAVGNPYAPTVLLQGETGTGKGLVARIIHDSGPRTQRPFLDVNCAAIPETLLEAELFGFEAGAFTDAKRAKPGLFEAASGGTLFLDEIEALPPALQSKLLTAIEAKRIRRLGAVAERPVDTKLIAATQTDLSASVSAGRFRADLYHRLAVVVLTLPPLRERGDDILGLAGHFLRHYGEVHGLPPRGLSRAAEAWLLRCDWPGTVRELSHLMERVTLLSHETMVAPESLERLCLPRLGTPQPAESGPMDGETDLLDEPTRIRWALEQAEGNVLRAARLLGLGRGALRHRMRRYGIGVPSREDLTHASSVSAAEGSFSPQVLLWRKDRQVKTPSTQLGHATDTSAVRSTPITAVDWARKPVTILTINVTFPEPPEPEAPGFEPWTVAARWQQRIEEKVNGFGGLLLQRSPSLFVVAFGIPRTLEQLPHRAVHAALAIRESVAEAAGSAEQTSCPAVRMAVHGGTVLVDDQASDPAVRVLPVGETLTLPVRLSGFAVPGEILLSAHAGRLAEGWCEIERREIRLTGGEGECLVAYALIRLGAQPSPLERMGQRALSRFVGRERELATLRDILAQVQGGRGQVVGIVGEPGVGKSRLLYEFHRRLRSDQVLDLEADCSSYSTSVPYMPLRDLLKAYFHLEDRDGGQPMREQITSRLRGLDETLSPTLPAFLTLLDVPVDDPQWHALDPSQRRQRILEALKHLLLRESQVQPVVLIVENLHWIDTETQAFLDSLVDSLPTVRLLLLVSYRPEYQHGWAGKTFYAQLRLDPLPRDSAQELLGELLGDDAGLTPLKPRLIEWTEGNAFFLEESIQTLVETRVLVGAPGSYQLAKAVPSIQVPATVQAVLTARIDRLTPEVKAILQSAAVIGRDVPFALLQRIVELSEEKLRHGMATLQAAEFLYETRLFPEREHTFKHALTHEVAYGSLLQERRRMLHVRILTALEELYANRIAEQVDRLAHHAIHGEVWDKALTYCQQAGAMAYDRAAFREAVAAFEQALQALAHLPENGDTRVLAIELRLALGGALRLLGEYGRHLALSGEAEALARALDDRARLVRVLTEIATGLRVTGALDGARAVGWQALELAAALGESALQGQAVHRLGQVYYALGDFGRAAELLRRNVEAADRESGTPSTDWQIESRAWLARTLGSLGAFAEGRRHGEEALRLATLAGRGATPITVHTCLGYMHLAQGDLAHAIRVFEQGLALCRASGHRSNLRGIAAGLGYAAALHGRVAEGRALLEDGISEAIHEGQRQYPQWVAWLSEVCRLAGRGEEAWQYARQALDLARQQKARGDEALAQHQLGVVLAHTDPFDVALAERHYRQALALAETLGMRPLQAHCHLGLGTLYVKTGLRERARAELATAIALYRAMDMTFWLPQAEAALAQTGGGEVSGRVSD